jgi:hypothetical protein
MQPTGALLILMGSTYFILAEKLPPESTWLRSVQRGFSPALWFLSGAATAVGLMAGYFLLHGALEDWVYDNFFFLFTNYRPYESWPGVYSPARLTHLFQWVLKEPSIHGGFYFLGFYFFAVVGPAIGFSGAVWQIRRHRSTDESRARILLLFILVGIGSLVSELHSPDVGHLLWASPIILILFVAAWDTAIREWGKWRRPLIAAAVMAFALVAWVGSRRTANVESWNSPVQTRRGTLYMNPDSAEAFHLWIDAIDQAVPAGGETYFFPYDTHFYFLTATRNPTKFDVLISGFHSPQQIEDAISSLQARQPRYVFSFDRLARGAPRAEYPDSPPDFFGPDEMEKSLGEPQSHYRKVGEVEGMEVWTLKK